MSGPVIGLISTAYLIVVVLTYMLNVPFLQFCFGLPWSMVVAMTLPLTGHMFGSESWPVGLFLAGLINVILISRMLILRRINAPSNEVD